MALAASVIKSYLCWAVFGSDKQKGGSQTETMQASPRTADTRFHQRFPIKYRFKLLWQQEGQPGQSLMVQGKNISESGLLVESSRPFDSGDVLIVYCDELQLMGSGTVRHCRRVGAKYRIGLEFRQPLMRTF